MIMMIGLQIYKITRKYLPPCVREWCQDIYLKWKRIGDPGKTNKIHSQNIRIEFGIEECAMLMRESRKREKMDGIKLKN